MAAMSDRHAAIKVMAFEVFVAHVGNDNGQQIVFSSVPAEADKQRHQLSGVLQGLGMTPQTPVTVLSDGAVGPRALGEAERHEGPVRHILDWFHLAMRIQHVAQCVKGWPDGECPANGGMTTQGVRSVGSIADRGNGDAMGVAVDCDGG